MTEFNFFMPVKIFFGENALAKSENAALLGKHALIVTGRHSAKTCGALDDVTALLDAKGIGYTIYDKIGENPLLSVCYDGGQIAKNAKADFVIGIGGGSPLDAAKAIAAFATNTLENPDDLFTKKLEKSLPLVVIPTTAGTGSEGNNYSVLTLDNGNLKKTFKNEYSYAEIAILNPKYTYSLGKEYTISTALDAFCHCLESYLSPKATDISLMLALYGGEKLWYAVKILREKADEVCVNNPDVTAKGVRKDLLLGSLAGGVAINITGTGFPHPMGYSLTLNSGIPHGRACAVFTGEYIKKNAQTELGAARLYKFSQALGTSPEEIAHIIPELANISLKLDKETRIKYVDDIKTAGNFANSPYVLSYEEMLAIYDRIFS